MYNLFLDDCRFPHHVKWINLPDVKWQIVRSYEEFTSFINKNGLPDIISFDHDLADEHYKDLNRSFISKKIRYDSFKEKTGYECAQWLIQYCVDNKLRLPHYEVHSMNPIGRHNIKSLLRHFQIYNQ